MMRDEAGFESNEKITGREPVQRKDKPAEQMYDREVPITGVPGHTLLHDWLDGEVDAMRASEVEGKSKIELWTRINAESEMLRRRVTPVHVQQKIMASLPDTPGTASNWWKQQVTMTPVSAIAIGVALLAVGALIIQALRKTNGDDKKIARLLASRAFFLLFSRRRNLLPAWTLQRCENSAPYTLYCLCTVSLYCIVE